MGLLGEVLLLRAGGFLLEVPGYDSRCGLIAFMASGTCRGCVASHVRLFGIRDWRATRRILSGYWLAIPRGRVGLAPPAAMRAGPNGAILRLRRVVSCVFEFLEIWLWWVVCKGISGLGLGLPGVAAMGRRLLRRVV